MSIWPKVKVLNLINKDNLALKYQLNKNKFSGSVKIIKVTYITIQNIKYIIRYYVCLKCCENSIKLLLKCLCKLDSDFCITYLKNTKLNVVTYSTATKIF